MSEPIEKEDSWSESSEDELEDEIGDLVTENMDQGIDAVLKAIRSNDPKLTYKKVKFFPEIGEEGVVQTESYKPMYLKDYQREHILGQGKDNKNEAKPETYAEEQSRVREDLIAELNKGDSDEDEDEDLLTKREGQERELPEVTRLPDPEKDEDAFLTAFVSKKAWVPTKKDFVPIYNEVVEDEQDSEEFDDLNEKFESAYNFRYEDPNAGDIVSYARDQSTLRRGKLSSRQRKREKEHAEREKREQQEKLEIAKKRKEKAGVVASKLAQLQEALGEGEDKVAEMLASENLDGDWNDDEWDRRMQKLFDDEYYSRSADAPAPEDDLGEAVGEVIDGAGEVDISLDADFQEASKLSRKELKRKAEQFVDANKDLLKEPKVHTGFRYREVDAESFGLSSRDILLASDQDLNRFAGLKKLASYREREKMEIDRKNYSKKKRLRQWRQEVFGKEDEPTDELWEKAKEEYAQENHEQLPKKKHKAKKPAKSAPKSKRRKV